MSFANQVAFQMNAKLGGEPWAVKILMKNTMVIGYDTYHDTLKSGVSVGAVEHEQLNNKLPQCGQPSLQPAAGAQRQHVPCHQTVPEEVPRAQQGVHRQDYCLQVCSRLLSPLPFCPD